MLPGAALRHVADLPFLFTCHAPFSVHRRKLMANAEKKKLMVSDNVFKASSPMKLSTGEGDFHGTFGGRVQYIAVRLFHFLPPVGPRISGDGNFLCSVGLRRRAAQEGRHPRRKAQPVFKPGEKGLVWNHQDNSFGTQGCRRNAWRVHLFSGPVYSFSVKGWKSAKGFRRTIHPHESSKERVVWVDQDQHRQQSTWSCGRVWVQAAGVSCARIDSAKIGHPLCAPKITEEGLQLHICQVPSIRS